MSLELSSNLLTCSSHLQELAELGARKNGLGLFESINLLITSSLADFEILHHKIAALMKFCIVIGELLKFKKNVLLRLVGLGQISLSLGLLLGLVHHLLGLGLDGSVGLLDEILIGLLGVLLRADGI